MDFAVLRFAVRGGPLRAIGIMSRDNPNPNPTHRRPATVRPAPWTSTARPPGAGIWVGWVNLNLNTKCGCCLRAGDRRRHVRRRGPVQRVRRAQAAAEQQQQRQRQRRRQQRRRRQPGAVLAAVLLRVPGQVRTKPSALHAPMPCTLYACTATCPYGQACLLGPLAGACSGCANQAYGNCRLIVCQLKVMGLSCGACRHTGSAREIHADCHQVLLQRNAMCG